MCPRSLNAPLKTTVVSGPTTDISAEALILSVFEDATTFSPATQAVDTAMAGAITEEWTHGRRL